MNEKNEKTTHNNTKPSDKENMANTHNWPLDGLLSYLEKEKNRSMQRQLKSALKYDQAYQDELQKMRERHGKEFVEELEKLKDSESQKLTEEIHKEQKRYYEYFIKSMDAISILAYFRFFSEAKKLKEQHAEEIDALETYYAEKIDRLHARAMSEYQNVIRNLGKKYNESIIAGLSTLVAESDKQNSSLAPNATNLQTLFESADMIDLPDRTFENVMLRSILVLGAYKENVDIRTIKGSSLTQRIKNLYSNRPDYDPRAVAKADGRKIKKALNQILEPIGKNCESILDKKGGSYHLSPQDVDLIAFLYFSWDNPDLKNMRTGKYDKVSVEFCIQFLHYLKPYARDSRISTEDYNKIKEKYYRYTDKKIQAVRDSINKHFDFILSYDNGDEESWAQNRIDLYVFMQEVNNSMYLFSQQMSPENEGVDHKLAPDSYLFP